MLNFKGWWENVYRIDKDPIGDFSANMRTYYRSPDWKGSGTFDTQEKIPSGWQKEKGVFAGKLKDVIPYATPLDIRWVVTREADDRPTVVFDQDDKRKIASYRPYLSQFSPSVFSQTPSGEFFSSDPRQAQRQEMIRKPLRFIQKWYNVKFVPDLEGYARRLKAQGITFDSEGLEF